MQAHLYSTNEHPESIDKVSHIDHYGNAHMVDVSNKIATKRQAVAMGRILLNEKAFSIVTDHQASYKGSVLAIAQLAGIMAAKHTASLIPLCHNILLTSVQVTFNTVEENHTVEVYAHVGCEGVTGCEMEALTAASSALLTIYDMTKGITKDHMITDIKLIEKSGGKSGHFSKEF
jgi:cyclic pyranopterin phosphate synthase